MTAAAEVSALDDLRARVAEAAAVLPVGARTHWEVGNAPLPGVEIRAPAGVLAYDPAELTVTVGAGTPVGGLDVVLAEAGQECPLDPRSPEATIGGTLAAGLSGHRRLRYGPVRDRLLEVRFVAADGRVVKGGGATVKNVTGYDLPRLLVGSMGTVGVITQVILRCQPRPIHAEWTATDEDPRSVRSRLFRPSCIAWDGAITYVLLEGHPADVAGERAGAGLEPGSVPSWPDGPHRGRISVRPDRVGALGRALEAVVSLRWIAEVGVGTVHVAGDRPDALVEARSAATQLGGWLLREQGAPTVDGFGVELPNAGIMRRIREAFDPDGKLSPGRMPFRDDSSPGPAT